ncbi:glycoside hydrolase family 3 C-terminal domain-containing protein [Candidatus Colwellia aromaticivorans]|uniref:glycoside hydrolase family 3 C-terminal domain-containing protein n=1 Tax=Candidatus Colwellia aromaticivorans TaxID=2267621 RepID=UPI00109BB1D7|nr:glycoside hydrolase family 3 C-terminal domain-containing protein [Candidatus Colwellia aromaticivorans]
MKIRKVIKWLGYSLLTLFAVISFLIYRAYDYTVYPVAFDKEKFPQINTKQDLDKLTHDLISQMSLDEKIDQMYGQTMGEGIATLGINHMLFDRLPHFYVAGNERLNIPRFAFSDGPRGVKSNKERTMGDKKGVTSFPISMSRGASWDLAMESRIYEVIAKEMRASGVNYTGTPTVNLLRHPAWGRAQEVYSEDPWLMGEMGLQATLSLQKHNVMSCVKHFALNSIENSRFVVDVEVDERTLREVYLPHFKKVIQQGNVASVMSSYNKVNGIYAGNHKYLLTDILRDEWGFEGFVINDFMYGTHDAVASINAGLNVEMPFQQHYQHDTIKQAIADGEFTEARIDELVFDTLRTQLKYGFAQDPMEYPDSIIATAASIALTKEAAEKGMVLLKNSYVKNGHTAKNKVLPFSKQSNQTVAVIGRLADVENTGDKGSSGTFEPYVITPYQGIAAYNEKLGNKVVLDNASDLNASKALAKKADQVIVVVGYTYVDEGEFLLASDDANEAARLGKRIGAKSEGGDRESLKLLPEDEALIQALANTNDNLVVVYVGGSGIDMSAWDDKVPAILFSWYSGMEGGNALANILYGEVNPSGKLPFSIAKQASDYPYFTPYTDKITYGYYHGYTLFDKKDIEPAYPFGFGLSYTDYNYSDLEVITPELTDNGTLKVQVTVTNSGKVAGDEIVQLYIGFAKSHVDRPVKLLRDFDRLSLQAGESKVVELEVAAKDMAWYNPEAKAWQVEHMDYEVYVGSSSAKQDLLKSYFSVQ